MKRIHSHADQRFDFPTSRETARLRATPHKAFPGPPSNSPARASGVTFAQFGERTFQFLPRASQDPVPLIPGPIPAHPELVEGCRATFKSRPYPPGSGQPTRFISKLSVLRT